MGNFQDELKSLINRHSEENESDTPDFILAQYLCLCLDGFNKATRRRDQWHVNERKKEPETQPHDY